MRILDNLMSVPEAAERLGVNRQTLYLWLKGNECPIKSVKIVGRYYFKRSDLDKFENKIMKEFEK